MRGKGEGEEGAVCGRWGQERGSASEEGFAALRDPPLQRGAPGERAGGRGPAMELERLSA